MSWETGRTESASEAPPTEAIMADGWIVCAVTAAAQRPRLELRCCGRSFRVITLIDEYTRGCLAIDVTRRLTSEDMLERLNDLFIRRGAAKYLRSDNGPEFTANRVRDWLERVEVPMLFIEPGSPFGETVIWKISTESFVMSY